MKVSQDKLRKASGILYYVFMLFYVLSIAVFALGTVFFISQFFLPDRWFTIDREVIGFTLDNVLYFNLGTEAIGNPLNVKTVLQVGLPFGVAIIGFFIVGAKQVMLILKSVTQDNPFDEDNSTRLYKIAKVLMVASLVVSIARVAIFRKIFDIMEINVIRTNFSIDTTLLLVGLLVLILAGVFKYGSYLKSEYDSTI